MKHSKVEACIICEETPCTCYAKKKAPKKYPGTKVFANPSALQAKVNEIVGAPPIIRDWGKPSADAEPALDFEVGQAIRNLGNAGLLTDVDRVKYRDILSPTPSNETDRRLADWRKRNGLA